ncbi:MAG: biotin transporter BioY [Calditrichaeota bacterium]|nr:biotin transporter BioY [Calditrichota bacterium]
MIPVPVTLQTLFVFLAGGFLGARWGAISQLFYLFLGFAGLPVFAGESGPMVFLSPTIGYLLAFPLAALFCGVFIHRGAEKSWGYLLLIYSTSALLILSLGVAGLYLIQALYLKTVFTVTQLFVTGLIIFLPGELLKVLLSAWLTRRLGRHALAGGLSIKNF